MTRFVYEAKKDPLNVVRGSVTAENAKSAVEKLGRMGLYLLRIEEENPAVAAARPALLGGVRAHDVGNFTRELSDLLEAGLPLVRSLQVLEEQTPNKRLKDVVRDVRDSCVDGRSLSDSLARHPDIFSAVFVSLVRSGETSGALEEVLKRYAEFNEKRLETQLKVRSAMAYPLLMSVMGLVTILVLMTFVIPKMMGIFEDLGHALPLPTLILVTLSRLVTTFWPLVLLTVLAGAFSFHRFYKTDKGRRWVDAWTLKVPVFGTLLQKVEIARFANTLATLLASGVGLLESLKVASETVQNRVIRSEISMVHEAVRRGSSFAGGFGENAVFPITVKNMIAVGEESGRLEKALFKVAEIYDRESDASIKMMVSLLEPVLILTLGLVVGFIVISILLPIFELSFVS